MTEKYGKGWSYPNLKKIRQFYIIYSKRIISDYPIQTKKANHWLSNSGSSKEIVNGDYEITAPKFMLSWAHYIVLLSVDNPDARSFYEIEAKQQNWSVRQSFEHPTIGILLCERKNDSLVELTLPKDANIYASQYQLYLPDKGLLQAKLREWIAEFEENKAEVGEK